MYPPNNIGALLCPHAPNNSGHSPSLSLIEVDPGPGPGCHRRDDGSGNIPDLDVPCVRCLPEDPEASTCEDRFCAMIPPAARLMTVRDSSAANRALRASWHLVMFRASLIEF
jgi:hypothetical protein